MPYKISEVADMAGVSVRTLHYYDKIGLLQPESINAAGYRFYTDSSVERLQQVLFFKEIGLSLLEIKNILDHPGFDRKQALKTHRELLVEKRARLDEIIETVEKTIQSIGGGLEMSKKEMFDAFDMCEIEKHQAKYAEEARQKYGNTDAYKESRRKTSGYTREDWAKIMGKEAEIYKKLAALMDQDPSDPQVQELIAQKRQLITDSYYNCTPEIFRGLGDLYVSDERFTANIDQYGEGLARFLSKAMHIYCDHLEK